MSKKELLDKSADLSNLLAEMDRAKAIIKSMNYLAEDLDNSEATENFLYMFSLFEKEIVDKLSKAYTLSYQIFTDIYKM